MQEFDQDEFNTFVLESGIVGFKDDPITLKSGRESHWYVNWRQVAGDAKKLLTLADFIVGYVRDKEVGGDFFYGVPDGATSIGFAAQLAYAKEDLNDGGLYPMVLKRSKPKGHGDPVDRDFVGKPAGKVIVIEDVTTTGGSLIDTLEYWQSVETVDVSAAIGLTNRQDAFPEGSRVEDLVAKMGIPYHALSTGPELLPLAHNIAFDEAYEKKGDLQKLYNVAAHVQQEFAAVGIELKLVR
jgi:orotate phosphoribosyltransferase